MFFTSASFILIIGLLVIISMILVMTTLHYDVDEIALIEKCCFCIPCIPRYFQRQRKKAEEEYMKTMIEIHSEEYAKRFKKNQITI